jgi:integrase
MTTKIKAAQHLDEQELNKLLKFLSKNQLWTYYIMVRLGVSTALRFSDLSSLTWGDVLHKEKITIKEKKTKKTREIPIGTELREVLSDIHSKLKKPHLDTSVIPLHASKAGIRGKRISTHTWRKTFGREVWRRNNYSEASLIKLSLLFNRSTTAITRVYLDITHEEVVSLYDMDDLFAH